jgi:tRNA wybutosine-synthesizing protein 3
MTFNFDSTKKDILNKRDKSNIGIIDDKILELCNLINSNKNYFTTSSCSGRILLAKDNDKKIKNIFLFRTHGKINLKKLKESIKVCKKYEGVINFKQEPCFVVVSCRDKNSQWKLFSKARNNGWKKTGILSIDKKFLIEIMSTENINFPIIKNNEMLVDDKFLEIIIDKANINLEKGWKKINRLVDLINMDTIANGKL